MTEEEILKKLQQVMNINYIEKDNLVGVFAYNDEQDIKICGLYVPTLEDFCFERTLNTKQNEQIGHMTTFVDIRKLLMYNKENEIFLDSLFSKYSIINPKYEELFNKYFRGQDKFTYLKLKTAILEIVYKALKCDCTCENVTIVPQVKFTKAEQDALKLIIKTLNNEKEGYISISSLIANSTISRPVFKNTLLKLEKNEIATVQNKGAKGTFIKFNKNFSFDN